jgi:transmembrane sensor
MSTTPTNTAGNSTTPPISREVRAEAAVWIARLHSPERTDETDIKLREWVAASADHAQAFEQATRVWDEAGAVSAMSVLARRRAQSQASTLANANANRTEVRTSAQWWRFTSWPHARARFGATGAAIATCCLLLVVGIVWNETGDSTRTIETGLGELRAINLADGTRVTLNTDTRIDIPVWGSEIGAIREVRLTKGEALFDVAKNAQRPFVVSVGRERVVAIGTSFVVRRDADVNGARKLAVTLVEGKVAITSTANSDTDVRAVAAQTASAPTLLPGQRAVLAQARPMQIDQPRVEGITAWKRGEVMFDNTPLLEAINEMNRYTNIKLKLDNADAARVTVGGIFRAGDSDQFANAVAAVHGFTITKDREAIHLAVTVKP